MPAPLDSLKVVEFAGLGPAPLAGQLLADLGAQVTVIDRASGKVDATDVNRRGKRSLALNLKSEDGRALAHALIAWSDILIEGFRPGVMERLGLGPADCPDTLIYGRMTGWGQTGPLAKAAGHDITYLATSGALSLMGSADAPPKPPLNLVADYGGGSMFLLYGLLAAVISRGVTGKGQVVDAAMIDGVPAMMGLIHGMMAQGVWTDQPGTNWLDGGAPFYRCYRCADGRDVAVGALEPQFYALLLDGLGLGDADLPDQNDRAGWPDLTARFAAIFVSAPRDHWAAVFAGTDACVAPVLTLEEAARDPHLAQRGVYVAPGGIRQAAPAPRFSASDVPQPTAPTAPGADTETVLAELGYDDQTIRTLRASGALT
ncbi:CaiB/BaiF CoA-transferase family protein [uncultured Tateyamaria sp.]|uniref:CaiB/BaiF CoA transferase family protein n=1 Tax=uncultured Tateyamaria sp. TaxID=455651 RepID=UPI00263401D0|nr:CaiB/BaiF CoA-transferase family protein [uncultured Tateyamaria sp.]